MTVIVADASAVRALEQAKLLQSLPAVPCRIAVSRHYCEREFSGRGSAELSNLGLVAESLSPEAVQIALDHLGQDRGLSLCDAYALALAQVSSRPLMTIEARVRARAERARVECREILSMLDLLEDEGVLKASELLQALLMLQASRCAIAPAEMRKRMDRYSKTIKEHVRDSMAPSIGRKEAAVGQQGGGDVAAAQPSARPPSSN